MKIKVSTSLDESLYKIFKIHAIQKDTNFNQLLENALKLYMSIGIQNDWNAIEKYMPDNTDTGIRLKEFCHEYMGV
jgi:hypothetical protein